MHTMEHNSNLYNCEAECCKPSCKATLQNAELWKQFHDLETEMIITKSGRRMFPTLRVNLSNLDPNCHYCVMLEMTPASNCRYKYSAARGWVMAGAEEAHSPHRLYLHPESPASGEHWMSQPVSFGRMKLTNTPNPPAGHVVLSSMHKYQPRIIIAKTMDPRTITWAPSTSIIFKETQFIAVTAYQNEKITQLKIDNNPFAKGFRENGQSKCKRKWTKEHNTESKRDTPPPPASPNTVTDDSSSSASSPELPLPSPPKQNPSSIGCYQQSPIPIYPPPYYHYPQQYPVYSNVTWTMPYYSYYNHSAYTNRSQNLAEDLTIQHRNKKPRKLTDFSITTIMGIS